ncbi:MAG: hypothetical protein K8R60_10300 [Burkholderiales bacterium]|nr:hypothetical protein [Burkholderiales bacterium]
MPQGLLAALNLPRPKSMPLAPPPAAAAAVAAGSASPKTAEAAGKPGPSAEQADLKKELNEAAKYAASISDDETKRELALALKNADKAREDALKLGNPEARNEEFKKVSETIKAARTRATDKLKAKLKIGAGKPDPKDAADKPEVKDGKPKFNAGLVTDKGKLGLGGGVESEAEKKTAKGTVVNCNASFEGKAYVESKPIPYAETPGEMELTFHLVLGGKVGVGAKREREAGADGKSVQVNAGVSVEYELVYKRKATADENKRYIEAMKSGKAGGFEELRALELAVKGSMNEARALAEKFGAKQREMKDDEEVEENLSATGEAGGGVSQKKGAFGISLNAGVSVSGSLSRKIAMKDGMYWITLQAVKGREVKGGAGFTFEGVGMEGSGGKEAHEARAVTFVIDPGKPELKPLLKSVMAAKTIPQMLDLRAKNPAVASFDVKTTGDSDSGGLTVTAGGVGMTGGNQSFGSDTEIDGPDGKTTVHTGGNSSNAAAVAGDKTFAGSKRTDKFSGGRNADGTGFGETSATDTEGDLVGGVKDLFERVQKSPLTTLKNLKDGKEEISKEKVRQEGAAFTDDSYTALAERAKGSPGQWGKYWRGDIACYTDWVKTQARVKACGDDRDKIAKVIADFERGTGRGRHDTVRNAISGTEIPFEFPASLSPKKPFFDALVVNDPVPAALGAGAPEAVLKKVEELLRQVNGFRDDMSKSQAEFARADDYQDMAARLDQRRAALLAAQRSTQARIKAKSDEAKGINQFTPNQPLVSKVDPAKEKERIDEIQRRIEELKRNIGEAYADEQRVFSQWEIDLKGFTVLGVSLSKPDLMKIIAHENHLRKAYPGWDKSREDLRKLLGDAGPGYDAREADVLQPDRPRYRALRAKGPQAGWNKPDGV